MITEAHMLQVGIGMISLPGIQARAQQKWEEAQVLSQNPTSMPTKQCFFFFLSSFQREEEEAKKETNVGIEI